MYKENILENETGKFFFVNDILHRTDGPAIIRKDGTQKYYNNGKLHRTDGPAVIDANGTQKYYNNGKLHREDGPAVIDANGDVLFYWKGKNLSKYYYNFNYCLRSFNKDHNSKIMITLVLTQILTLYYVFFVN